MKIISHCSPNSKYASSLLEWTVTIVANTNKHSKGYLLLANIPIKPHSPFVCLANNIQWNSSLTAGCTEL